MLCQFVVDIILRRHHRCRINGQLHRGDTADNNHHATGLRTPGALIQFRFVALGHIGNGNQRACVIIQTQLTHPEAAHLGRNDQLSHDIVFIFVVRADFIQRMTPDLIDEFHLPDVRLRQCAAAITDGHHGQVHFFTTRHRGRRQFCRTGSGDNRFKFRAHSSSLIRDRP